jgi:hypothetical protein
LQGPPGPSGRVISFNLGANGTSAPITIKARTPVQIIAATTTPGFGIGQISVLYNDVSQVLMWAGYNSLTFPSTHTPPSLTGGIGPTAGAPVGSTMLVFDFTGDLSLRLAGPDQIVIHNGAGFSESGLLWIFEPPTN